MKHAWIPIAVLATTMAAAAPVSAQEKGQVGLVMGYPASVGVQFHLSDGLALRPEVTVSTASVTSTYNSDFVEATSNSDSTAFGFGLKALFYLRKWDSLRAFVTPGFVYARSDTASTYSLNSGTSASNSYQILGSFGAQYALSRRFGILGEVGVQYSDVENDSTLPDGTSGTSSSSKSFGTRAAVGVVFYLK
jgi:hypothetical protein